ncbi:hypothetical protein [Desulfobacula sp.]|uniref:hypothetical protein n=1 Tax=Desulfobacula sp. TaxID=2593537 RepID=UPI00261CE180|nr:hypothetical protein [Desulfobacula sp.]
MLEFERLYELKVLCNHCNNPEICYFDDLDNLLKSHKQQYVQLAKELNRLDLESWVYLKKEFSHELCQYSEDRGWSPLFNRLNEAKGYGYLLDNGCKEVQFIPCSKKQGIKTPDLLGWYGETKFLCEVKTINKSDIEIKRRKNGLCKEVNYELNAGLQSQVEIVVNKAISQLKAYNHGCIKRRIVYIVVNNDDWQPEVRPIIYKNLKTLVNDLVENQIEIAIHLTEP